MFSPFKSMELADHSATVQMSGLVNPLHSIVVCSAPMPSLARTMRKESTPLQFGDRFACRVPRYAGALSNRIEP